MDGESKRTWLRSSPQLPALTFFSLDFVLECRLLMLIMTFCKLVESYHELLHNRPAFTSPVDEVVAWGEDTWP